MKQFKVIITLIMMSNLMSCAFKKAEENSSQSSVFENIQAQDSNSEIASVEAQVINTETNQIIPVNSTALTKLDTNYYESVDSVLLNLKNTDIQKPFYLKYTIPNIEADQSSISLVALNGRESKALNYKIENVSNSQNTLSFVISISNLQKDLSIQDNSTFSINLTIHKPTENISIKSDFTLNPTVHISEENIFNNYKSLMNGSQLIGIKKVILINLTNATLNIELPRIISGSIYKYIFEENNRYADCENSRIFVPNKQDAVFWNTKDNLHYKYKENGTLYLVKKNEVNNLTNLKFKFNSNSKFQIKFLPKQKIELNLYYEHNSLNTVSLSHGSCGIIRSKENTPNGCHIDEYSTRKRGCENWEEVYPYNESACMLGEPIKDRMGMTVGCYSCKQGYQRWKISSYGTVTESAEVLGVGAEFINPFQTELNKSVNFSQTINTHILSGEIHPEWPESANIPTECNLQKL